ncbi:MAG: hypothetical protein INR62_06550 [Rhodospirillales bacterium]|nr:hypothetical protein [Acetobacter sp.]
MKLITLAVLFVLAALSARAQESILPEGQYSLVSVHKGEPTVQKCEIIKDKDGVTIKFAPPLDHPEFTLHPVRVFIRGDKFQFIIGPSDYPTEVADKVAPGAAVYVGKLFEGKLIGVVTVAGWGEAKSDKFLLAKP